MEDMAKDKKKKQKKAQSISELLAEMAEEETLAEEDVLRQEEPEEKAPSRPLLTLDSLEEWPKEEEEKEKENDQDQSEESGQVADVLPDLELAGAAGGEAPIGDLPKEAPSKRGALLLSIRNLKKKIGSKLVLDISELDLEEGTVLGILGENGSGKTTLLRILSGLAHATSGQLVLDKIPVGQATKALVSYLPDRLFLPEDMHWSQVRSYFQKFFADFDGAYFNQLSAKLGIPKDKRIKQMSKGYQDRLQVALVLSRRARLYLLDEPFGGVDPIVRDEILDLLLDQQRKGATMLITTHQIHDLERVFDQVCFLKEGRIVRRASRKDLEGPSGQSLDAVYKALFKRE